MNDYPEDTITQRKSDRALVREAHAVDRKLAALGQQLIVGRQSDANPVNFAISQDLPVNAVQKGSHHCHSRATTRPVRRSRYV